MKTARSLRSVPLLALPLLAAPAAAQGGHGPFGSLPQLDPCTRAQVQRARDLGRLDCATYAAVVEQQRFAVNRGILMQYNAPLWNRPRSAPPAEAEPPTGSAAGSRPPAAGTGGRTSD